MGYIRKLEDKEQCLREAFRKLTEGKEIQWIRLQIEKQLKEFLSFLEEKLYPNQRIFDNVETRIKTLESFGEKIHRKGYLQSWEVTDDEDRNCKLIAKSLPDLIGFRITCFFWKDESCIYRLLQEYDHDGKFSDIVFNFQENCEQQNKHPIYKVTGLYDRRFCFELQIKSIMHNIWGEVDHKTIYKNENYDPNIENKRTITEEIFNILQASDQQLLTLFNETTTEEKLLQSLFFERTKKEIFEKSKTKILAKHYERFFNFFSTSDDRLLIKEYVVTVLSDKKYRRKKITVENDVHGAEQLMREIEANFYEFDLKTLYQIASIIYCFSSYRQFLYFFANRLLMPYNCGDDRVETEEDAFDDMSESEDDDNVAIKQIIVMMGKKLGRVKE